MTAKHLRNVCIVGNIASGKSTLTTLLAASLPNSIAIPESFEQNPFLELYMQDPPRWAFTNSVRYLYDYVRVYRELVSGHVYEHCFIDAGVDTNRQIYGRYLVESNLMTPAEYDLYNVFGDLMLRSYAYPDPDAYIFVDASPEVCFQRMHLRAWKYQTQNVGIAYLQALAEYHAAFRARVKAQGLPVLRLDSDTLNWFDGDGVNTVPALVREFLNSAASPA